MHVGNIFWSVVATLSPLGGALAARDIWQEKYCPQHRWVMSSPAQLTAQRVTHYQLLSSHISTKRSHEQIKHAVYLFISLF